MVPTLSRLLACKYSLPLVWLAPVVVSLLVVSCRGQGQVYTHGLLRRTLRVAHHGEWFRGRVEHHIWQGKLLSVHHLVKHQFAFLFEFAPAKLASELFLLGYQEMTTIEHVFDEVVESSHPCVVIVAFVSRVDFHVVFQIPLLAEAFLANFTRKGFFACVQSEVTLETAFLAECFPADPARERFNACVKSHVTL